MIRILLFGLYYFSLSTLYSQVEFYVLSPSPYAGNYNITYVGHETGTGGWGSPNMDDPENMIIGELVMAIDSTESDSLICQEIINGDELEGKIAVFYRGECQFGTKLLAAQNAGAIAGIIINNSGQPVEMGPGSDGFSVNIPMAMISTEDGALLRNEIISGGLYVMFGNKTGVYPNDLGIRASNVLRAQYFSYPWPFNYFSNYQIPIQIGGNIINLGNQDQQNVKLKCLISFNNDTLYNEVSQFSSDIAVGDTVWFDLPQYEMEFYDNRYFNMIYEIIFEKEDDFPEDNSIRTDFKSSSSTLSYAGFNKDSDTLNSTHYINPFDDDYSEVCLALNLIDESSIAYVAGVTFSAASIFEDISGSLIEFYVYKWNTNFENFSDPNYSLTNEDLTELYSTSYLFTENIQKQEIYLPIYDEVELLDEDRFLFCLAFGDDILLGYDMDIDYQQNVLLYDQPMMPISIYGDYWIDVAGTSGETVRTDMAPAFSVNFDFLGGINDGKRNIDIKPYPNPSSSVINIPIEYNYGFAKINILDVTGKVIKSLNEETTINETIKINVSDIENGVYFFEIKFEKGFSNFKVIVNH